ncbi:hypothetical protein E2P86_08000 [Sphingobacterium psychroaquaticum]|uniref:hypothetical protein n=1 Tax=Sphingobacterium psychroaquaticum TaxID=561061 RepID=UPI0010695678|nr:hypothetical protein [Sphingobacterium psychroaquaticum]QBQ41099.1 hypothetical protein E2P86_08000 [Sphingobacterium psychroaquaticum]
MKDFYKENRPLFYTLIVILLLFCISFIVFYGKSDLFKFPFDSGVWGNAADWCMTVVTGFTAFYLVKTFREQRKTTEIEQSRFIAEIKPFVELKIENNNLVIMVRNNTAYNVVLINKSTRDVVIRSLLEDQHFKYLPMGTSLLIETFFKIPSSPLTEFVITIFYSDKFGNNYKQDFMSFNGKNIISMDAESMEENPYDPDREQSYLTSF